MNFKPLTTLDELKAAQEAGLRVEATTVMSDTVDMPPSDEMNSGEWIISTFPKHWIDNPRGQLRVEVRDEPRYPDEVVAKLVEAAKEMLPVLNAYAPNGPITRKFRTALNNLEPKP